MQRQRMDFLSLALGLGVLLGLSFLSPAQGALRKYTFEAEVGYQGRYDKMKGHVYLENGAYVLGDKITLQNSALVITPKAVFSITAKSSTDETDSSKANKVFVSQYYDYDSDAWYTPVNAGAAAGSWGSSTTSIAGYIVDRDHDCFRFAVTKDASTKVGITTAQALIRYNFRYTFVTGDYYSGYEYNDRSLYAKEGWKPGLYKEKTELNDAWKWIVSKTTGHPVELLNKCYLTKYYDAESRTYYTPLDNAGLSYGYIIENKSQFRFGLERGTGSDYILHEADVSSAYTFRFAYKNNKDYYLGTVYAPAGKYAVGYCQEHRIDNGSGLSDVLGYYTITKVTPGYDAGRDGQVYVDSYYDAETRRSYTPHGKGSVVGRGYLGFEFDYILTQWTEETWFGNYLSHYPFDNYSFWEADAVVCQFNFRYDFANGDYYTGYVYAPTSKDHPDYVKGYRYTLDYVKQFRDENGQIGSYSIYQAGKGVDHSLAGQVFVDTYYNAESKKTYQPLHKGTAVGTKYLGSESDYILTDGVATNKFGIKYLYDSTTKKYVSVIQEADDPAYPAELPPSTLPSRLFTYSFTYANGDRYTGVTYAPKAKYYPGYLQERLDEAGQKGVYRITRAASYTTALRDGWVTVYSYYDAESGKTYYPAAKLDHLGAGSLGSEGGYILAEGKPEFHFGANAAKPLVHDEADVSTCFSFRTRFRLGDYYTGTVYAPADKYYVGYGKSFTELNPWYDTGYYTITAAKPGYDAGRNGQVFVDSYFDSQSNKSYAPVNKGTAVGTHFLASESDAIVKAGVTDFQFGRDAGTDFIRSADVSSQFLFKYFYGTPDIRHDYYAGSVYARAALYFLGIGKGMTDENGHKGFYIITSILQTSLESTKNGQVTVTSYWDGETQKSFSPLHTYNVWDTNYLGSESDYIITPTVAHRFGWDKFAGKFYEADE